MMKTMSVVAFAVVLSPLVFGQNGDRLPQASLDREINIPRVAGTVSDRPAQALTPPSYCKPCLFYAGDFDENASDANGLANEKDILVSTGAATYTPFIVPAGKTWNVTGLFTNNFMFAVTLDPKIIPYEVRKDVPKRGGNGGTLVCHGRKPGTLTLAVSLDWVSIYAAKVENIRGCRLPAGKYWMTVIPYCTNPNGGPCKDARNFLSNNDGAMAHRFGPMEPANDSFFNSVYFGAVWEPSSEQQSSSRFSVGVEGTSY
jgi:hypothetical protein